MSNLYPPHVLPRVELKYKAKDLLRGNWPVLIGVTLLYLLLTGFQVTMTYGPEDVQALFDAGASASIPEIIAYYFGSQPLSMLGSAIGSIGVGTMAMTAFLAIISSLLIDGVLSYCFTAWFIVLAEIGHSRPLSFGDFAETFSGALKGLLAYIWQQLWIVIWSLAGLPGFVIMLLSVGQVTISSTDLYASTAVGGSGFGMFFGGVLYIAGTVALYLVTLRYIFIFQLVADGRGKVGARQALRYSCAITRGHLKELFVLELSWIPWFFAVAMTLGLAGFYLIPYVNATYALAYRWLRDQAFNDGRLDPAALGYVQAGTQAQTAAADDGPVIDI